MKYPLQSSLPISPWADPKLSRLPGILPLDPADWLLVDDAYAGQMALREQLLNEHRSDVLRLNPDATDAARETLSMVLGAIGELAGFHADAGYVTCPDGRRVLIDIDDPLATAGRLVQEDLCIMQDHNGAHVLTGAVLCFPASWTLSEKYMHPLVGIHRVVDPYDENVARRVQRLFDAIKPGRPLWRANAHFYDKPDLYAPCPEDAPRTSVLKPAPFMRSERQCLMRLPKTGAVVFSIHTFMLRREDLTPAQIASLPDHMAKQV